MSVEGGSRFSPELYRGPGAEDPFGRGIEARADNGVEDAPERENSFWIAGIITPERLEVVRRYPAYEGHTDEWVIMQALLATSVEKGPGLDPAIRRRLSNLIGVLRLASYPNLNPPEQEFIRDLMTKTTTVDFSALTYDVTPETQEDIRWIWSTFDLNAPLGLSRSLPPRVASVIHALGI